MNIGEIKSGLRIALQKFISEDDMSLRSVSYNSGCNRHFLNKVLDDRPVKSLDISQVLLLTMFLSRKSTLKESIQSAVTPVKDILQKAFTVQLNYSNGSSFILQEFKVDHPRVFLILDLARFGIEKQKILNIIGESAIPVLEELLEREAVFEDGDKIHCDTDVTLTLDQVKQYSQYLMENFYSKRHAGMDRNYNALLTCMVTPELRTEYYNLCKEFHGKISSLSSKSEHCGGHIPIFISCCMDSLTNNE